MGTRASKNIATHTHVGKNVPDEIAFPLVMERLLSRRRITPSGCWEYTGHTLPNGYGEICFRGRQVRVHRLAYSIVKGQIPKDKIVCHTCDNTVCFNPEHLELGTYRQNTLQSVERRRHHATLKTHCAKGHAFAKWGVIQNKGNGRKKRACRLCGIIRQRIAAGWTEHDAKTQPVRQGRRPSWIKVGPKVRRPRDLTRCKNGHEFTEASTYFASDGTRSCRICRYGSVKRYKPRKPETHTVDAGDEYGR